MDDEMMGERGKAGGQALAAKKRASHDSPYPEALVAFMLQDWQAPAPAAVEQAPIAGAARFAARRRRLGEAFPGEVLVIPTGHEKVRAADTLFPFRPGSDFYYLTGNREPDCVLVLWPRGDHHEDILFVEPNPGRGDPSFFTDRHKGALWVGPRLGVAQSWAHFGVDRCEPLPRLSALLAQIKGEKRPVRVLRDLDPRVDKALRGSKARDAGLATCLSEMRLCKDAQEQDAIAQACQSTRRAFDDVVRAMQHARSEREIEAAFMSRARIEGSGAGYNVIAAAGANACVLHWTHNDGVMKRGELLLLDAGIEGEQLYTADITRTLPIAGTFTTEQREVYDLVVAAQEAAFAAIAPGAPFLAPHEAAMRVLAEGLERLGILPISAAESLAPHNQYYKRYTLHGVSHMLGIDVHDCGHAREARYRRGTLQEGMVLTVEPGLYLQPDDLTVPSRYRGIGIRIEDDVAVTATGYRLLSDLPRRAADVERWIAGLWTQG